MLYPARDVEGIFILVKALSNELCIIEEVTLQPIGRRVGVASGCSGEIQAVDRCTSVKEVSTR